MANTTSFAIQTGHSTSTNLKNVPYHPKIFTAWHIGLPRLGKPMYAPLALPTPDGSYIKRSKMECYIGDARLSKFSLAEADVLTLLEQSQHPNIGRFLGCILLGDLLNGLYLKHYPLTLADAIPFKSFLVTSPQLLFHLSPRNRSIMRVMCAGSYQLLNSNTP